MKKKTVIAISVTMVLVFSGGVMAGLSIEDKLTRVSQMVEAGDVPGIIARLELTTSGLMNIPSVTAPGTGVEIPTSFLAGSPAHSLALAGLYLKMGREDRAESLFERLRTTGLASYNGYLWEEDGFNNRNLQPVLGSAARYFLYKKKLDRALVFVERAFDLQKEINSVAQRENGRLEAFVPMVLASNVLYTRDKDVPAEENVDFLTFAAIVYQKNDRLNDALPLYEKAVENQIDGMLAANNTAGGRSSDFYYLMQAYVRAGRPKEAEKYKQVYTAFRERERRADGVRVRHENNDRAIANLETLRASLFKRYPGYLAASDEALELVDEAGKTKDPVQRELLLATSQSRMLAVLIQQNCELMEQNRALIDELRKKK